MLCTVARAAEAWVGGRWCGGRVVVLVCVVWLCCYVRLCVSLVGVLWVVLRLCALATGPFYEHLKILFQSIQWY